MPQFLQLFIKLLVNLQLLTETSEAVLWNKFCNNKSAPLLQMISFLVRCIQKFQERYFNQLLWATNSKLTKNCN